MDIQHYAMQTIIFVAFLSTVGLLGVSLQAARPFQASFPILSLRFQDLSEASETREAEQKHQHQLEKALQDAEIRAQKEHRSWHRERQHCEQLQEELKISTSEAAAATAKVGENTDGFTKKKKWELNRRWLIPLNKWVITPVIYMG